jgi:hypothetical protein
MISLSEDVETLARRAAAVEQSSIEDTIRRALEDRSRQRRASRHATRSPQMVALGGEPPLLNSRSPSGIMDDLSAL